MILWLLVGIVIGMPLGVVAFFALAGLLSWLDDEERARRSEKQHDDESR